MAGRISELVTALSAAQVARATDRFEITDTSAGAAGSKYMTPQELSKFVGYGVNVLDYGASPSASGADNSTAFAAAIAAVKNPGLSFEELGGGGRVFVPRGVYSLASDLIINCQVHLEGEGGMDHDGTRLLFANGKGIKVQYNIAGNINASWTIIKNLRVHGAAKTVLVNAIEIKAHGVAVENVSISNFKGNGIDNFTTVPDSNGNNWILHNVRVSECDGHGVFIDGPDSNAGVATMIDSNNNGGWGIYDSSFLGNTYVACHTAANTLGAYKTDSANARNVFIGCYSESGQPASALVTPTFVVGGLHAAGFTVGSTHAFLDVDSGGEVTSLHGLGSEEITGSDTLIAMLGGNPSNGDILKVFHTTNIANNFRLRHSGKNIRWDYANSDAAVTFLISGPTTLRTYGRSAIEPYAFETDRLFIGSDNNARLITMAAAAPASGAHAIGEVVFNSAVAVGQPNGWRCTVAGTPGTWVAMANL